MRKLIIVGGGEHAACVHFAAVQSGFDVSGFVDIEPKPPGNMPYLGADEVVGKYVDAMLIVGVGMIGPTRGRRNIVDKMFGRDWATVVHPRAVVAEDAKIGHGSLIMPGAIINPRATVGEHCIINTGAIVEHDCEIGAFSHLSPGVVLGGGVRIGENSMIGLGARIRDHVSVGSYSFVAMASTVTKSHPDNSRLLGSPATPGWNF